MPLGPVMLDIQGTSLNEQDIKLLSHPMTGGVILFTRNFESLAQLTGLLAQIRALREPHLLVAVDHEGGRVQRFREDFTRLPAMHALGELHDRDPARARRLSRLLGWLMASELLSAGVDFSFAPVLDLNHGVSGIIGDRAFHRRPSVVIDLARQWIRGMNAAGMQAVGKHFPGHGGVREDSHLVLPIDRRPLESILDEDLLPFEALASDGLAGIMPAHVVYERVDPHPAGFSSFWLQRVLRERLGFKGAVFSDDLSMAATEQYGGYAERARLAIEAGCDMVLVCNHPEGAAEVLQAVQGLDDPVSMARLARMHGRQRRSHQELCADPQWQEAVAVARSLLDPAQSGGELPV